MKPRKENPTRYRATWEFELRYPSDYEGVRSWLHEAIERLTYNASHIQSDFLVIEKVEKEKIS